MAENSFDANAGNAEGKRFAKLSLDYLNRAQVAQQHGEDSLATSLYLTAFDCAKTEGVESEDMFIEGLRQAWFIAATDGHRTLAEYIFELLEPYLSDEEIHRYASRLQDLAFDRLEEFGVSREELEDVLASLPPELAELGFDGLDAFLDDCSDGFDDEFDDDAQDVSCPDDASDLGMSARLVSRFGGEFSGIRDNFSDEKDGHLNDQRVTGMMKRLTGERKDASAASEAAKRNDAAIQETQKGVGAQNPQKGAGSASEQPQAPDVLPFLSQLFQGAHGAVAAFGFPPLGGAAQGRNAKAADRLTYADMAGFERAIDKMQTLGIGFNNNPELRDFIAMLNEKHGLSGAPVCDSIIFRSPAREDASHFMEATLGELGIPGMRVHVDENIHGDLVLCVMAQTNLGLRLNTAKGEIEGSGVLLLEDIDLWGHLLPFDEECRGCSSSKSSAAVSKGSREAFRLIQSAVESPDVYVLASCSTEVDVDGAFLDFLEPFTVVDIEHPTESERASLWNDLMNRHPSMKGAHLDTLVTNSKGLARFDIYMAAREAVEASYKASLASKAYQPITTTAICEKLAAYQPLESDEYKFLEEQVISDFRQELDNLDALLGFGDADNVAALLGETPEACEADGAGQTASVAVASEMAAESETPCCTQEAEASAEKRDESDNETGNAAE